MNNDISYYPQYAVTPRYVKYMNQRNQIKPSCIYSDNISSIMRIIKSVATFTKIWNKKTLDFVTFTTGHSFFAECRRHSAKVILHSTKALPSVTLGKERSANCTSATASLPSTFCRALCRVPFDTRQRKVTVTATSDGSFAECLLWHSAKEASLPSVWWTGTRQRVLQWAPSPVSLPSALATALGKESSSGPLCQYLCRVPWQQHLAKMALPVPRFPSLPSAMVSTWQRWLYQFLGFLLCRVPRS
jgi:hypothetical protein